MNPITGDRAATAPDGARPGSADPDPVWPMPTALLAEVELEAAGWAEIVDLVDRLTPPERLMPGYFADPPWSVKDLVGHLGAWHAEAREQLLDLAARSYLPHDIAVERRNERFLRRLRGQPWEVVWREAISARVWMLEAWSELREPDDIAAEWIRKAGAEHYAEHLPRLRAWVDEVSELRSRPAVDERDP
jgi:hypothetical protein